MGKSLQRDYYFDNARAILIFFVVFGHLYNHINLRVRFYRRYT